ncbi:MAG TPA: SigE family RNA polymerase sigma factor [Phytomonospora sp.]
MSPPSRDDEFGDFVASRTQRLRQFAYICCGDWHRAEDVVQTALVRLYAVWDRPKQSVDAYVRRIIVNQLFNERRRLRFTRERVSDELPEPPGPDTAAVAADRVTVVGAMLRLPRRQRAAIALRFWEDLSVEDTAKVLGCSTGAVKNLTMRGIQAMREFLTESDLHAIEGALR